MAQPTPYEREFNFSNQQSATPSDPLPAPHLDAELNRVKLTTDEILANLALFQNDEGEVTIGYDQLDPEIIGDIVAAGADPGAFDAAFEAAVPDSAALAVAILDTFNDAPLATAGVDTLLALKSSAFVRAPGFTIANNHGLSSSKTKAQNKTAMDAAIAAVSATGGVVFILPSASPYNIAPFTIPSNVVIDGLLQESVILSCSETVGTDFIGFTAASGSFKWGGIRNVTINNGGSATGGMAIYTPVSGALFSSDTHWIFENIQFRGTYGWTKYMRIGDANQGCIKHCEWRGPYNAAATDVGQTAMTAIELTAATGNIGVVMDALMIVGVRTGLHLGDNCEGFQFVNSEIVGGWDGIVADPASSKPGGFIDNIHINVNHHCISATRKRDLDIGSVQCYRSNTFFDHTGTWKGIYLADSDGCTIGRVLLRVIDVFVNDTGMNGVELNNCDETHIGNIVVREASSIDVVLQVTDCVAGTMGSMIPYSNPKRIVYAGSSSDWHFGKIAERGTTPTSPYTISATDKAVSFDRLSSADENYIETNLSVALTDVLYAGVDAQYRKYNVAVGAGAYTVNLDLDGTAAKGDVFEIRFTFLNSTNGTVKIRQGSGGSDIVSLNNGTGANWFPVLKMVHNGAGWTLFDQHNSVV